MSVKTLLARHGAHDELGRVLSGRSEIALNGAGEDQAKRLAARLAEASLDAIFTSPQRRARQTAEAVADRCGLDPIATPALDEIDFGEWAGRTFDDLATDPRWRSWNEARASAKTPAGETMASVTRRAADHLSDHLEAYHDTGTVLCVSHCDVIRGLVLHYSQRSADSLLSFDIDPGSLTTIEMAGDGARVLTVNEHVS